MKKRFDAERFIIFLFTISIFCNGYLFYTWSTYSGVLKWVARGFQRFGFILLPCLLLMMKRKLSMPLKKLLLFFAAVILQLHICCMGLYNKSSINITIITLFVDLFCFFLLKKEQRVQIHKYAIYIFAVVCLPSALYFILKVFGLDLPSQILYSNQAAKIRNGVYYLHFPFGLLIHQNGVFPYRLSGVFDEAGFVGSLAALFIASGYKRVDKKWIILLLFEGIVSLSMAFYLLLILFIFIYSIHEGAFKFAAIIVTLLIAFFIFMNVDFDNSYVNAIKNRIDFTSSILVKDNRTSSGFDREYASFMEGKGYSFYMGNGKDAVSNNDSMNASYSYKCLIYDYGVIGFTLYLLFFAIGAFFFGINMNTLPFLIVFFVSIYQRPYVFTTMYVIIYFSALELINNAPKVAD